MFSNEFEFEGTVTTVLDEEGNYEDIQLIIEDDAVYIKQYNDSTFDDVPDLILMSPKMFKDMLEALNHPEGFYKTEYKRS